MTPILSGAFGPLAAETTALVERLRRSVVLVHHAGGHGSGVVWPGENVEGGLIVTNEHVVAGARGSGMVVELADGRRLQARVTARDPGDDPAALRVAEPLPPPVPVGDAAGLRVGEILVAVGNPFGVRGTATLGIVSAAVSETGTGWLQADVTLAPGNSGGPLANTAGEVVGIASRVLGPGIALAVPSHVVRRFLAARFVAGRRAA